MGNYVKPYAFNSRLFQERLNVMGSNYDCFLFYTEVYWLSHRKSAGVSIPIMQ